MAFEWSLVQSTISAITGLGGVWLGGQLTSRREEARESERNMKDAAYLAILVVAHLNRFANRCLQVALDDGTEEGRSAGNGGCYEPTVVPPVFDPLTLEVNWRALPAELMYEVLSLPQSTAELERHIGSALEFDGPPDYSEFFWTRQRGYAVLGLQVSELATRLFAHAGLPATAHHPTIRSRDDLLLAQRDKIDREMQGYEALVAAG
jgi:hypothetical protein